MTTFETVLDCARRIFGDAAVQTDENVLVVTVEENLSMTLFSDGPDSRDIYFRSKVAALAGTADPGALCEDALQGNFFWQGTEGASLSLNDAEQALYLTDRRDAEDLDDDETLRAFCERFLHMVLLWRARRDDYLSVEEGGKEAL